MKFFKKIKKVKTAWGLNTKRKRMSGFTMMELIIGITIVAIMTIIVIGILNPKSLSDRGYDARRKKDINRIKVAFEEYYNDKGCFPRADFVNGFECNGGEFAPWMSAWPCDPGNEKYKFVMGGDINCPNSFKIFANLRNKSDKDIPQGWYNQPPETIVDGSYTIMQVNYGVSSSNVKWFDTL